MAIIMEKQWDKILERERFVDIIRETLQTFHADRRNLETRRGIFLYGASGCGKTTFVTNVLKSLNYDIVKYDAGDVRNKSIMDMIAKHNMSDKNVLSMIHAETIEEAKKIVILIDEIDGMSVGDKGGINSLIKMIRPKKTKKQKEEDFSMIPIVCIGNYQTDKKIKDLMKACVSIELPTPTREQMLRLLESSRTSSSSTSDSSSMVDFLQGDLRKLKMMISLMDSTTSSKEMIARIFKPKTFNDDIRQTTCHLINQPVSLKNHFEILNETDRTIVGLLWHENVIDRFGDDGRGHQGAIGNALLQNSHHSQLNGNKKRATGENNEKKIEITKTYIEILENLSFADFVDRTTFQKQIWQFNEMSSLLKVFQNNHTLFSSSSSSSSSSSTLSSDHDHQVKRDDIRFTKVLTKYSTEYNNSQFLQTICQQLGMDRKDMLSFFIYLRKMGLSENHMLNHIFQNVDISKLDLRRIYRYIDLIPTSTPVASSSSSSVHPCDNENDDPDVYHQDDPSLCVF